MSLIVGACAPPHTSACGHPLFTCARQGPAGARRRSRRPPCCSRSSVTPAPLTAAPLPHRRTAALRPAAAATFLAGAAATGAVLALGELPAAAAGPVFRHGVASGDPLGDAVLLWTRVTPTDAALPGSGEGPPVVVQWQVAADAAFRARRARGTRAHRQQPGPHGVGRRHRTVALHAVLLPVPRARPDQPGRPDPDHGDRCRARAPAGLRQLLELDRWLLQRLPPRRRPRRPRPRPAPRRLRLRVRQRRRPVRPRRRSPAGATTSRRPR